LSEGVLDASVVLKRFAPEQCGSFEARELRNEYEAAASPWQCRLSCFWNS
jgi:hypothetical protein